jgi:FlaA1/EpsC-like NDP-sugar epimerase
MGTTLAANLTACFIDLVVVNVVLWAGIVTRFLMASMGNPYQNTQQVFSMIGMHSIMSASFLLTYTIRGVYSKSRYTPGHALVSGLLASTIFIAGIYFTQVMAFSRIAFAFSAFVSSFALVAWREIVGRMQTGAGMFAYATGRVIVIGDGDVARRLIHSIELDRTAHISGIVWPREETTPGQFEGYPVLGSLDSLKQILRIQPANLLLVATAEPWYSHFIEALATLRRHHLSVKWVRPELLLKKAGDLPEKIPLQDFNV